VKRLKIKDSLKEGGERREETEHDKTDWQRSTTLLCGKGEFWYR